jgi:competence protein ComEC
MLQNKAGLPVYALCFLSGIALLQFFTDLPDIFWVSFLPVSLFLIKFSPPLRLISLAAFGFLWALLSAHWYFMHLLPESMIGEDIWIEGYISEIPGKEGRVQRFPMTLSHADTPHDYFPKHIRLSWYGAKQQVNAGEKWRLLVRLKPPHGFSNQGGFDYESWLFQNKVHATGYIRNNKQNYRISSASDFSINRIRQQVAQQLMSTNNPYAGLLAALAVGYKGGISAEHWEQLKITGTNHLMAISGLHIGLVAGFFFWLVSRFTPAIIINVIPSSQLAALTALIFALIYALLAGFAIPTQRAMLMLLVVLGGILLKRPIRPGNSLSLALIVVLLIDPVAVLSPGFWFSFLAVAVIAYSFSGRLHGTESSWLSVVYQWGRLQWVIALALFPVSLFLFQQSSIVAPLVNLILVPWVSFLVVPVVLLGLLFSAFWTALADFIFGLADTSLSIIWPVIEFLGGLPLASWQQPSPPFIFVLLALAGVALLLAPKGLPLRWSGIFMLLPALFYMPVLPENNEFKLVLLDVGQGLSVFVQTRNHSLLFDAGPKFSDTFDTGDRVVVPYFRSQSIETLDKLIISHGDNDHIGGAQSILEQTQVEALLGQDLDGLVHDNKSVCQQGQKWQWDGVNFEILHPDKSYKKRNNHSCVLKVSNDGGSLLIASDIEKKVERRLLMGNIDKLDADILVVPHHGSKTSSTKKFISAVSPKLALVASGYMNRFRHPRPVIVERYENAGAKVINTADTGAISITVNADSGISDPEFWRFDNQHYWNYH